MKFKILVLAGIAMAIVGIGLIRTVSKSRLQQRVPKDDRLRWHIQQAKNQGLKKVSISAPVVEYLGSAETNIDKALSEYTVVVAEPIESRTYEHTPNNLITWYKFKTVEALTPFRPPLCFGCLSLSAPNEMLPLLDDQFVVPRQGGTIFREGVELSEVDASFPSFEIGQKYLMLISLYPSRIALTAGGPVGIFRLDDNEKLTPISEEDRKLNESLNHRFQSSLAKIRVAIKKPL